jgi:hypothetical protein
MGISPKPLLKAGDVAARPARDAGGYRNQHDVYGAGGYRFADFTRVGLPLNILFWILAVVWIPKFWHF